MQTGKYIIDLNGIIKDTLSEDKREYETIQEDKLTKRVKRKWKDIEIVLYKDSDKLKFKVQYYVPGRTEPYFGRIYSVDKLPKIHYTYGQMLLNRAEYIFSLKEI